MMGQTWVLTFSTNLLSNAFSIEFFTAWTAQCPESARAVTFSKCNATVIVEMTVSGPCTLYEYAACTCN